ncbi:ferrous iron transport protein B [Garciella nitratireducens]|uniref:Ferrous iron transport protein B n=1 Tax=Garciella nitratireducens DSM 15102 TaxID=1121911 RepID=A0A1T4NW53_9FIRM|nr:ferrous iron transport protein B [Garciella nitratireducens]SJZ83272.1 ferrous iron transport protein B [Garciella nitratireducens DSM 15102]
MGLTKQSTGISALNEMFEVQVESSEDIIVALAGNPNTGKSTVFNSLTGLNQHTGNWPGKTVTNAQGKFLYHDKNFVVVDLPGTYSLLANSVEEQVARDFICFGNPHVTVVVVDATCLERNLNLALQIMEITDKIVLCVNLLDEAKRKKMNVHLEKLSSLLGIPVVGTAARNGVGLKELKDTIEAVAKGDIQPHPIKIKYDRILEEAIEDVKPLIQEKIGKKLDAQWIALRFIDGDQTLMDSINYYLNLDFSKNDILQRKIKNTKEKLLEKDITIEDFRDYMVSNIVKTAEKISKEVVTLENKTYNQLDRKMDNILTSKVFGIPIMIFLLGVIFWITIKGANYPSQLLSTFFSWIEEQLTHFFTWIAAPDWIYDILILGIYRTLAWVVSVMLPPMAIFFPLFTLLEDLGYLPRVAFNLDHFFKKACSHGKQALTMCMGFGCNAAGVVACRIIDSPRERLIATITNNFVPCNGRFPTLIALSSMFIANSMGAFSSIVATLTVLAAIVLGVMITLIVSKLLSKTILKGLPSSFTLELPPYRKPQVGRIIVNSIFDRTLFVLGRAVAVAAPAGLIIWMMANITIGDSTILSHCAGFLDPFARLIGLDGYILMAFILGLPANEIVIPILIMSYLAQGSMLELGEGAMRALFIENGWTWLTAVCMMLFSLNHWPCATTLWTIRKETQSVKWTLISFLVPTIIGVLICFIVAQGAKILGFV